jgi:hypothetical protein
MCAGKVQGVTSRQKVDVGDFSLFRRCTLA